MGGVRFHMVFGLERKTKDKEPVICPQPGIGDRTRSQANIRLPKLSSVRAEIQRARNSRPAQGNLIRSWVNGTSCADFRDTLDAGGFIGLQVDRIKSDAGPYQARWRNLRIRGRPPTK